MLDTSKIPTKRVDGYYTHITNCITKIPQDIKLEIVDGMLKLKAGSKVYNFYTNTYSLVKNDIDYTAFGNATGICVLFTNREANAPQGFIILDNTYSGDSLPEGSFAIDSVFFNIINKKFYRYSDNWSEWDVSILGIATLNDGKVISIDQVFNGFGYIGNTIFVLPGVEGIIPNGFNEDGSIKNIHCQIEEVQTKQTLNGWNNHWYVHLMGEDLIEYHPWELYYNQVDKPMSVGQTAYWYNPNEKIVKSTDDFGTTWNTTRQVTPFLEVFQNGETITSIKPINVYENITSKTVENKFKVVSELPSFPEVGVFYFVKE